MLNKMILLLTMFFMILLSVSVVSADDIGDVTGDGSTLELSNSSVVIEEANATVGYETPLVAKVTSDNFLVNEGIVTFYDSNVEIGNSSLRNGIASINFTPKTAGIHTIDAIFTSDSYLSSNFTALLNISKAKADLFVNQTPASDLSGDIIVSVSILSNSKPVNEGTIEYFVNGNLIGTGYVYNGMQRMRYTPDSTGSQNLEVVFGGTDNYYVSSQNNSYSIVTKTNISAKQVTTVYNGGKYLVAALSDVDGTPIGNATLTIFINGTLKSFTTDDNGQVKLLTNALAPGNYDALITFEGNCIYENSTFAVKVTVKKATPKLTAKNKSFKVKTKTKKYAVTLKTNKNVAMKKVKLTLKIKGKIYRATTNNNGKATFKITNFTKKGKFSAIMSYAGNKYYNSLRKTVKIIVK